MKIPDFVGKTVEFSCVSKIAQSTELSFSFLKKDTIRHNYTEIGGIFVFLQKILLVIFTKIMLYSGPVFLRVYLTATLSWQFNEDSKNQHLVVNDSPAPDFMSSWSVFNMFSPDFCDKLISKTLLHILYIEIYMVSFKLYIYFTT